MLSAAAAVCTALPPPDAVPVAGLAGLVNARAWYGLTAAIARPTGQAPAGDAPARLPLPAASRVPAGAMVLVAVVAAVIAALSPRCAARSGVPGRHGTG